jgi:MoaA/NifB/PqqE/SkfB family radical SAM enzyme
MLYSIHVGNNSTRKIIMINGLSVINIELTSRCNKKCWMCGRRERERLYGDQNYGDMDLNTVLTISQQIPSGTLVQLHNNGEPLLYDHFGKAVKYFRHCITNIVTNGKLLVSKSESIIGNLDIITISIIENDDPDEKKHQMNQITEFLKLKSDKKPFTILRFLGDVDQESYRKFGLLHVDRTVHLPKGSVEYRRAPTIPEYGICKDLLSHLAIDRFGNVSMCVRFDPEGKLILGNIKNSSLSELWNCEKRMYYKKLHVEGKRKKLPYCGDSCDFYGVPTGR